MKRFLGIVSMVLLACILTACNNVVKDKKYGQTKMNATASTISSIVEDEISHAALRKSGMLKGAAQEFNILIEDGVCTVSAADPKNFSNESIKWGSVGRSDSNQSKQGEKRIADSIIEWGFDKDPYYSIYVAVYDGAEKIFVACTDNKNILLQPGVNCPKLKRDGGEISLSSDYEYPKNIIIGTFYNFSCEFKDSNGERSCSNKASHGGLCDEHFSLLDNTYKDLVGK